MGVKFGISLWKDGLDSVWDQVVGRILGPKREKVTKQWRILHNEDIHNLYSYTKYYYDN